MPGHKLRPGYRTPDFAATAVVTPPLVPEVPPMITRGDFAVHFLAAQNFPTAPNNIVAMLAWMRSEQGDNEYPNVAVYNPLDTTQPMPGSWDFNSAGVKNYRTFDDGITASVTTLAAGFQGYVQIRACLRSAADPFVTAAAIDGSVWGSHPSPAIVAEVQGNLAANAALAVGPGAVAPAPPPTPGPAYPTEVDQMQAVVIVDENDQIVLLNGQPLWLCVDPVNKCYWQLPSLQALNAAGPAIHMTPDQFTTYRDHVGITDLNPPAPEPTPEPAPTAEPAPAAPEAAPAAS